MARPLHLGLTILSFGWSVVRLGKLKLNASVSPSTTSSSGDTKSHHGHSDASEGKGSFYNSCPLSTHFGIEALDINLNDPALEENEEFVSQLKQDLVRHRAILFRSQNLSGQKQVNISNALGTIYGRRQHPKSPHPDIFRISNNESEGFTGVGITGWHNDGTFLKRPYVYLTMYFPSVAEGGDTHFIPLKEFYDSFSSDEKESYSKLWLWTGAKKSPIHPVVYKHPLRPNDEETMLFHVGTISHWYSDVNTTMNGKSNGNDISIDNGVDMSKSVSKSVVQDRLTEKLNSQLERIGLRMKWKEGDFLIIDNLGLAHVASQGTQQPSQDAGLRILHCTAILGDDDTVLSKLDGRKSFSKPRGQSHQVSVRGRKAET